MDNNILEKRKELVELKTNIRQLVQQLKECRHELQHTCPHTKVAQVVYESQPFTCDWKNRRVCLICGFEEEKQKQEFVHLLSEHVVVHCINKNEFYKLRKLDYDL